MNSPIFNPFSQIEIENDASPAAGPDKRVLRGRTRFLAAMDELGWFPNGADAIGAEANQTASESTSNVNVNTVVGRCGRCAGAMVKVGLTTPPDTVYFCDQCRVTTPMTDEECAAADRQLHLGVRAGHQC